MDGYTNDEKLRISKNFLIKNKEIQSGLFPDFKL